MFQSDVPLLPFVTSELHALLGDLNGQMCEKGKNLKQLIVLIRLAKLNVSHAASHVAPSDIDIGFAAKATVDKALREKKISQLQVLEFRKECEVMLQTTVSKIQERKSSEVQFGKESW